MSASKTKMPQEFQNLEKTGMAMIRDATPFRKQLLAQGAEALSTGGVKAKIPLIQQMVSQSNQALSSGLTHTAESLTKHNIGGPFAQSMLAGQRQQGLQQIAGIPTSVAERVIQQTTPFAMGTQQAGMGAVAQAGQAAFATDAFNALQFKAAMQDIKSSLQGAGAAAACLHPDAKIETPNGDVEVSTLQPGDVVWTQDSTGNREKAYVTKFMSRTVDKHHVMMRIADSFYVTPTHPDANGLPVSETLKGSSHIGVTDITCDIAVDGPTGIYFIAGIPLGSTLDSRFSDPRYRMEKL